MKKNTLLRKVMLVVSFFVLSISSIAEETKLKADDLFRINQLIEIDVKMLPADWEKLRKESDRNNGSMSRIFGGGASIGKRFNLYKADISVDGNKIKSVGIRTKGFIGSLNPERPSLKIKFNEYVDQSPVQGLDRLTLNNNVQDMSLASQFLTYKLFNKAGIPAPRVSHCKVTVNGEYLGVYSHVESVRSPFIKKHFQKNSGELYEGTISDFYPIAVQNIEAKNSYTEKNRTQALKLAEILETKEGFDLNEAKKYINLKQFVRFWAMESLLGFWDGYTNNQNNYYAYSNPNDQKRFHFIPWGADGAFTKGRGPFGKFGGDENHPNSVYSQSMLANRLFQSDEVKGLYKTTMVDILKNVWDENEIIADIKRIQAFTMDHLHSRQNRLDEGAGKLITFVENRRSDIEPELDDWPISIQGGPRIPRHSVKVGELSGSFKTKWINERMRDVSGEGEAFLKLNLNGENIAISDLGSIGQPEELRRWFGRRGSEQSRVLNPTITLQGVSKNDGKELTVVITVDLKDFKSNDKDVSFRGSLNLRDIDDDQDGNTFRRFMSMKSLEGELKLIDVGMNEDDSIIGILKMDVKESRGGFKFGNRGRR
ncbi:CotH kinase family protein [Verrucomicrobia bacterium]|nr:CotH kinase family protein [Verrucomicrobiota bacterium]